MKIADKIKKINNENGATSVLVVFMVIILSTLGVFAMVSANVNLKSAKKVKSWNEAYFAIDAKAEKLLSEMDSVLYFAENVAADFVSQNMGSGVNDESIYPEELVRELDEEFKNAADKNEFCRLAFERIYFELVADNLQKAPLSQKVVITTDGEFTVTADISDSVNKDAHIRLTIMVVCPNYNFFYDSVKTEVTKLENSKRYVITSWKEWQTPFEYKENVDLWDPATIDKSN